MKEVSYSPEARQDLLILKSNLSFEYGEFIAKKILTKITKSIRMLGFHDNAGIDVSKSTGKACDYKYFFTTKNYIFYRITGNNIRIIRVLNERQDFMRILFGDNTTSKDSEDFWND